MKVGTLVECMENFELRAEHIAAGATGPKKGEVYTIRAIDVVFEPFNLKAYIVLEELKNPPIKCGCGNKDCENYDEPYFDICSFRELPKVNFKDLL